MKRKIRVHVATEVDPDLWEQFREQAFAENLTTGQLLDKLISAYLEMVQGYQQEDTISTLVRPSEDIALEQEQQQELEEDQEEKT
jgi:hypothetical protein